VQFTPQLPPPATQGRPAAMRLIAGPRTLAGFASEILSAEESPVDVVLLDDANPVFLSPRAWRMREALERVPFIASFGSFLDETSILADLILPDHSFLETWVDAVPESGTTVATASVAPAVMRPLYATRSTPDVLLEIAGRLRKPFSPPLPWKSFEELLRERFAGLPGASDPAAAWTAAQEKGGWWASEGAASAAVPVASPREARNEGAGDQPIAWTEPRFDGAADAFPFYLLPYASTAFYDGSTAHLPWLQEMPDPMTSAMWSNWVEINPSTAQRLQLDAHDIVEIASAHGSVHAPVVITPGIAPDVVAMPLGQGHETFTRYASNRGSNPIAILAPVTEPQTGALAWGATRVKIRRVSEGRGELILFAGGDVEHPHQHR
jgi:anaerobic selenocysteine-containing dehydrogenase